MIRKKEDYYFCVMSFVEFCVIVYSRYGKGSIAVGPVCSCAVDSMLNILCACVPCLLSLSFILFCASCVPDQCIDF